MPRTGESVREYVADFETTTNPSDCRVWAWGLVPIDNAVRDAVEMDITIESFMRRVSNMNSHVYFHNLAFDGSFVIDWLFRNGYSHTIEKSARRGEFTTLISKTGKYYSIAVKWMTGTRTEFRDSYKKLPMSVSVVSNAFKLEDAKGSIDYHAFRPVGHQLTDEEKEYLATDVLIVAQALKVQFDSGMAKLTVGADALSEYRRTFGGKLFDRMFPQLPLTVDADIRKAYRGGFTYVDPRHRGHVTGGGHVFDVNSLYPFIMYMRLLPFGEPEFCPEFPEPTPDRPLFIAALTITARLKRGHIPCIQIKGSHHFVATEYQTNIIEPTDVYCTNVDLALWMDHYDIEIVSYNGGYRFAGHVGFFKDYIDKWSTVKQQSEGGMRTIAKLMLNSLYGKFATNPDVSGKVPIMRDNVVALVDGPEETRNPVYTPMGVFITAYAREYTIRAAQQHYDVFAYADTDSLHLITDTVPETLNIDPYELGAWKHELEFDAAFYARPKCYTERANGKYHTHIAGLPAGPASIVTFDHFVHGHTFSGKVVPRRVPGGVVLEDVGFRLTDSG